MNLVTKALVFAAQAHNSQNSEDGSLYIWHPIGVAELLARNSPLDQAVGLLHDTVEDTDVTLGWIGGVFGAQIADAVDSVTRRDGEEYMDYVARAANHPVGIEVKRADLLHNLYYRPRLKDQARQERLRKRYVEALDFLDGIRA